MTTPSRFDSHLPRRRYSDDDLLQLLRDFAATVGRRRFTTLEFNNWPERPVSVNLIVRRFGSWRAALARIGITGVREHTYTAEELIRTLHDAWLTLARRPGVASLRRVAGISHMPYKTRWGSLAAACDRLAAFRAGKLSHADLIAPDPSAPAARPRIPPKLRYQVLNDHNFRCALCGQGPHSTPPAELVLDHIHPHSKNGPTTRENLRPLCIPCNQGRSNDAPPAPPPKGEVELARRGGRSSAAEGATTPTSSTPPPPLPPPPSEI